jgi:hypothetical protein
MEEKKLTVDNARNRMQEILNNFLAIQPAQLTQIQLEYQYLRGFTVGIDSVESEEMDQKRPDLKAVGKPAN